MNTTIKAKLKFMNISNLPEKHIANQIIKQQKNKTNMRTIVTLFIAAVFCTACNQNYTNSKESFTKIEKELKEKFGDNAYYSNISVSNGGSVGDILSVTVTKDPASLKMEEWNKTQGNWKQTSNVTVELGSGKPEDFMFNLNKDISISKMGELIETAKKKLANEKKITDAVVKIASVSAPQNHDKSALQYLIMLEPKNGGTAFSFFYDLGGNLKNFSY